MANSIVLRPGKSHIVCSSINVTGGLSEKKRGRPSKSREHRGFVKKTGGKEGAVKQQTTWFYN